MKRTGNSKLAIVGWGRTMGHKGHMYLADAVITTAVEKNADPYFFISKTVGKDDPIFPEEKVRIYQKVFPQHANIFIPAGNLNDALAELGKLGYVMAIVVLGADQVKAFSYLEGKNKKGESIANSMGLQSIRVISRQQTNSQFRDEEGPRATPMREILLDPNSSTEEKFKVWRRDMPEQLSDREVLDIMNKAESRLVHSNKPKVAKVKQMSKQASELKEAIINFRLGKPVEKEPEPEEKEPESLGYEHLFKPKEQPPETPKHYHGWEEYEKEANPEQKPDEVEEARIINPNNKIDVYYMHPNGNRLKVAKGIPMKTLEYLMGKMKQHYNIGMNDIEIRPSAGTEYTQSSSPVGEAEISEDYLDEK